MLEDQSIVYCLDSDAECIPDLEHQTTGKFCTSNGYKFHIMRDMHVGGGLPAGRDQAFGACVQIHTPSRRQRHPTRSGAVLGRLAMTAVKYVKNDQDLANGKSFGQRPWLKL